MNVLLVDNQSAHLVKLKALLRAYLDVTMIRQVGVREVTDDDVIQADLVVISGGQGRSIAKNPFTFKRLVKRVEKHDKPTIGICLGAEAIAFYFGAEMEQLPVRRVGNVRVLPGTNSLSLPRKGFLAYAFHRWTIKRGSTSELIEVAHSKDGVEIFKHKRYRIWGIQFHPEVITSSNTGQYAFGMVLERLGLYRDAGGLRRRMIHVGNVYESRRRAIRTQRLAR